MNLPDYKELAINGIPLVELSINGRRAWKKSFTNLVPLSTEADGKTIYNGGLGYKDGYRVRSGGAEGATDTGSCTGFIPCKVGDTLRVWDPSGQSLYSRSVDVAINFSDSTRTNLGQIVGNANGYGACAGMGTFINLITIHDNNMWEYTIPASIGKVEYVRVSVTNFYIGGSAKNLIVTVNEEIPA